MKKLRKGDATAIKSPVTGEYLKYTGVMDSMKYDGIPCVFLARDINNRLTYTRFSQQFLAKNGYCI